MWLAYICPHIAVPPDGLAVIATIIRDQVSRADVLNENLPVVIDCGFRRVAITESPDQDKFFPDAHALAAIPITRLSDFDVQLSESV